MTVRGKNLKNLSSNKGCSFKKGVKLCYKAEVLKMVLHWHKNCLAQQNRLPRK